VLTGFLGFLLGIAASYVTDLAKLVFPVADLADIGSDYVATTVLLERDRRIQGELWVYPFAISEKPKVHDVVVQPPTDLDKFHQDIRRSGAIDANITLAKLIVEGKRNNPVRIVGVRAVAVSKSAPLGGGTALTPGPQEVGNSAQIAFDLDSSDLTGVVPNDDINVTPRDDDYFTNELAFSKYTVDLRRGEQQVFQLAARTYQHHVKWRIELELFVDGETKTAIADVNGEPLETTALLATPDGHLLPDTEKYAEIYDFFASPNADRFARVK
jgi:hypothetical protein